jgi:Sec-independent protein secretion pathway component TatC|eukprot:COSAG01_NODE_424_length_17253_cov_31.601900_13_plen_83_part_00
MCRRQMCISSLLASQILTAGRRCERRFVLIAALIFCTVWLFVAGARLPFLVFLPLFVHAVCVGSQACASRWKPTPPCSSVER